MVRIRSWIGSWVRSLDWVGAGLEVGSLATDWAMGMEVIKSKNEYFNNLLGNIIDEVGFVT